MANRFYYSIFVVHHPAALLLNWLGSFVFIIPISSSLDETTISAAALFSSSSEEFCNPSLS